MADTASEAEVKRDYPVTSGITADAKHEGRQSNLVPNEGSLYPKRKKEGL